MNNAIQIIFYIFNKVLDLLFNQLQIVEGVYLGWVLITIIILSILIKSILNIPEATKVVYKKGGDFSE